MKIIFDSNVWQIVTSPEDYLTDPNYNDFVKINKAIIDKRIIPYLSETIFTIEAIKNIERQEFFSNTSAKIDVTEKFEGDGKVSLSFVIGPNVKDAISFENRPILKKYFDKAIDLVFRIIRLPRIGGLVNPEVDKKRYDLSDEEFSKFTELAFTVGRKIEDCGAGVSQIKSIGNAYGEQNWFKGLKKAPQTDWKKIAKAAAEWADGDSVSIAIGINCDFFCTRDMAKNAGLTSVLSQTNLNWLKEEYNFNTILPESLSKNLI